MSKHKNKHIAVFGIYADKASAENAVITLKAAGYRNSDISILIPDPQGAANIGHEKGTKAAEGIVTGAGTGATVGGVLGWLAGIGALAIPGVGPLIAAGPVMGLLAGASVGGAIGGVAGALIGLGIPEYEAKRYEGMVKSGKALLSVHCDNLEWVSRARRFLEETGARDISSTGEVAVSEPEKKASGY